jgi:hypothetical protein
MNLLNSLLGRRDRRVVRSRRRPGLTLDRLEDRKLLSVTYGSFDGMQWEYIPGANKTAELVFVDVKGSQKVSFQDQYDGNDGVQQINGLTWSDTGNGQGGINFAPGTHVNIVVHKGGGENTFVNDSHQSMTTLSHSATPPATQTGSIDGMAWTFTYNARSNTGVLTITSRPGSSSYGINFHERNVNSSFNGLTFSRSNGTYVNGPALADLTRVTINVKAEVPSIDHSNPTHYEPGDNTFVNHTDFGAVTPMTVSSRLTHSSGSWEGMKYDLVSDPSTHSATLYWVNTTGTSRIDFQKQYNNDDMNPQVNGIQWALQSGEDGGGVDFPAGTDLSKVKIVLIQKAGDNTFTNDTGWSMTTQTRQA